MTEHREPPGYARCRDCQKQCRERFVDDTGLCAMCGLTLLVIPPNPLFPPPNGCRIVS